MERREPLTDAWRVLGLVSAAGGLAVAFMAIGYWLGRNRGRERTAPELLPPRLHPHTPGPTLQVNPVARALPMMRAPVGTQEPAGVLFAHFVIDQSPVRIVAQGHAARRVQVTSDQPILISNARETRRQGFRVEPGQPLDVGVLSAGQALFAVAEQNRAQVSVLIRNVGG